MTRLASLCLLVIGGAAAAQTSPWYVGASQDFTRDSNIYRLANGAATPAGLSKSDLISTTSLLAGLDQPVGRQRVFGSAALRSSRFSDNKNLNNEGYALSAGLDWATANRLSGTLEANAERRLARFDPNRNPNLNIRNNIEDLTRLRADAKLGVVTAYTAVLSMDHSERRYSASVYDALENRQTTATVSLQWRPHGGTMLGLGARHTSGSYPRFRTNDDGSFEPDRYTRSGVDLLGRWDASGASRLDARITLGQTRFDQFDARDTSGVTGFAAWTWRPSGRLTLNARMARDMGQDAYFNDGPFVDGVVDSANTSTTARLSAAYALSAKIGLRASVLHARRDIMQSLLTTDSLSSSVHGHDSATTLSLAATWSPTDSVLIGCDLGQEKRSADGTLSLPYSANRFGCYGQVFLR